MSVSAPERADAARRVKTLPAADPEGIRLTKCDGRASRVMGAQVQFERIESYLRMGVDLLSRLIASLHRVAPSRAFVMTQEGRYVTLHHDQDFTHGADQELVSDSAEDQPSTRAVRPPRFLTLQQVADELATTTATIRAFSRMGVPAILESRLSVGLVVGVDN